METNQDMVMILRPLYYPLTDVFILCFGFHDQWSLQNIKNTLEPEVHYHCPGIPFLIVGCKRVMITSQVCSTAEEMDTLIFGYLRKYCATSALEDISGIIEKYIQQRYDIKWSKAKFVSDEEANKLCKQIGGYRYFSCSALKMSQSGLNEIFEMTCDIYFEISIYFAKRFC